MKKVLFVSNKLYGGGSEQVLVNLANYFSNRGWEVLILALNKGIPYSICEDIDIHYFQSQKNKRLDKILWIRKEWEDFLPDSVISFEYFLNLQVICSGFLNKSRRRTKLIVSERNDPARRGGNFPVRQLRNLLYHFCDVLVCQTPAARNYFPASLRKKAVVIANPVKAQLPEVYHGIRRKEVVNFCRLEKQKNLPLLVKAFSMFRLSHPDYHLTIYGNGSERMTLQELLETENLTTYVSLHPAVADVHDQIRDAAMFVSSSDYEGLSNSMLEAMALGMPVICTDCPCFGAAMVVRSGENGILVPVGDSGALCEAMSRIAADSDFAASLADRASLTRELYSIETIGQKWEAILHA